MVPATDGSKEIPSFLNKNKLKQTNKNLKNGLKMSVIFNKTILTPNNINYPLSRTEFIKLILIHSLVPHLQNRSQLHLLQHV